MSDTAANTAGDVVKELGKVVTIQAAVTAAEVAGAVTILLVAGFVASKIQERRAKKATLAVAE